jgi:hypothetical protein
MTYLPEGVDGASWRVPLGADFGERSCDLLERFALGVDAEESVGG